MKNACVESTVGVPATGKFVRSEPSPICLPNTVPVEIVEKNPKLVDIVKAEILEADRNPVLSVLVLRIGGTENATLVISEPSPICLPNTEPVEIVEKNPNEVDIVIAE